MVKSRTAMGVPYWCFFFRPIGLESQEQMENCRLRFRARRETASVSSAPPWPRHFLRLRLAHVVVFVHQDDLGPMDARLGVFQHGERRHNNAVSRLGQMSGRAVDAADARP